ncbi:MAG: hypothetical protein AABZ58_09030 [Chloroflexota bacterium]
MNRPTLRTAIIALTLATAAIHLYLNFNTTGKFEFQPMFTLNALGYIALMVAFFKWVSLPFLEGRGKLLWYVYMGYVLVTILGWVAVGARNIVGYSDKVVEALLIAALWLHKDN